MTIRHCHDVRPLLMAYLDSELDPTTTLSLSEHVSQCAGCRARLEAEQQLERSFAEHLRAERMPREVSSRLDAALAAEVGGVLVGARPAALFTRLSYYAAAALVLVTLGMWLNDPGVARRTVADLSGNLVVAYERAAEAQLADSDLGAEVLTSRLSAPRFAGLTLPESGMAGHHPYHLVGSQELLVEGSRGLSVSYDCCGQLTSVLVLPLDELPPGLASLVPPGGSVDLTVGGVQTRAFVERGALIGVASRHSLALGDAITH